MTWKEAFLSAWENLRRHRLRAALTMLGIIFGVAAVIAMLAIGAGAEAQAMGMIERLGLRNVLVRAQTLSDAEAEQTRRHSLGVSPRDARAIAEAVPGVAAALPRIEIDVWRLFGGGRSTGAPVFGVAADHGRLFGLEVSEGRFLDALDVRDHAQVCVLGAEVRRELFGFEPALGREVKVNDVWLTVVGVLGGEGGGAGGSFEGVDVGAPGQEVYIPASTATSKFDRDPLAAPWDEIVVHLEAEASPHQVAAATGSLLAVLHGGAADYDLVVPEVLLAQARRTQRMFAIVMGSIAGISLLVGGIGIMNIMLATVLERTREIGVRRAVGATERDIRNQFLVESFSISLAGGVAGIAVGILIAWLVAVTAGWSTDVTAASVALSTGVALAVGLVSGLYPARRAAALDPIDALRYE
ncbi:MAG: ABC transporter permease [Thermoanaerobaculia bacterium]